MEDSLGPQHYWLTLRRRLWLVAVCAILAAGGAYALCRRMPPVYSATTTLLVSQSPTSGMSDYAALITSERLAQTYSEMLRGRLVMEAAIARLGLRDETPSRLAGRVSVELVQGTQLIRLSVRDGDPARAAQLANVVAESFIDQVKAMREARYADSLASVRAQMDEFETLIEETQAAIDALGEPQTPQEEAELVRLQTVLAGYRNTYASFLQTYEQMRLIAAQSAESLAVVEPAQIPQSPVSPRVLQNTLLAGIVGALLATGVVFLIEYLDDTIKTPDDVSRALGLSALGTVGRFKKRKDELIMVAQPLSPIAESFRGLRTNIRYSSVDKPLRSLLVTSSGPTEGKSFVVANLAVAMAQSGVRVVVVDADLRRPRLHHVFGAHPHEGLTGALLEGSLDGRLQPTQVEGLGLLPAGEVPPNPAELLGSRRMRDLLTMLSQYVDMVLVDSPPALPVTDAAVLAQSVDGVLVVVEAGKTRREVARWAIEGLRQVGANVIGVALNKVPLRGGGYYYYSYYGSGGGKRTRARRRRAERAAPREEIGAPVKGQGQ